MKNEITMELLCGRNAVTGEVQPAGLGDTDEVKCNGRRIALVNHKAGSGIRFLLPRTRIADSTLQEIVGAVSRLRKAQDKPELGERHTFLTDPEKLKQAIAEMNQQADDEEDEDGE